MHENDYRRMEEILHDIIKFCGKDCIYNGKCKNYIDDFAAGDMNKSYRRILKAFFDSGAYINLDTVEPTEIKQKLLDYTFWNDELAENVLNIFLTTLGKRRSLAKKSFPTVKSQIVVGSNKNEGISSDCTNQFTAELQEEFSRYGNMDWNIDFNEFAEFYRKSAMKGSPKYQNLLGNCYYAGLGFPKNRQLAVKWYRKSAEQGYDWGMVNLGLCYLYGKGVHADFDEAFRILMKAAEHGNPEGQTRIGMIYVSDGLRYFFQSNYTEAMKWLTKASDQGYARAQNKIGEFYMLGMDTKKDYIKAFSWFSKAEKQNNAEGQNNLGTCYYNGYGVQQDYFEAVKFFRKAAGQGYALAMFNLAECYRLGHGVNKDRSEALKWGCKAVPDCWQAAARYKRYL